MIETLQTIMVELGYVLWFFLVLAFEMLWRAILGFIAVFSLSWGLGKIWMALSEWLNEEVTIGRKREPKE